MLEGGAVTMTLVSVEESDAEPDAADDEGSGHPELL
jgi:hypothetical protein